MINNVILIGRLTKDIVLKKTTSGKSVCNFTLAVSRRGKSKEDNPSADFIPCIVWERGAEILSQYAHKGSQIGIEGSIQTRTYKNTEGKTIYITEVLANSITLLGGKQNGSAPTTEVQDDDYSIDFSDMPF